MWFPFWQRSCDGRPAIERLHPARSPRRLPRFRPGTEVLDERRLLSTLTVTSNLDGSGFVSRGVSDGTLRGEIAVAKSGDTIVFAPSLDGQTITLGKFPSSSQLEINKNLTIQGPGAGLLAIYGNDLSRVFQVDAGANVTISGLTIGGGDGVASHYGGPSGFPTPAYYDGCGGGILNLGKLTLSGCTVVGNDSSLSRGTAVGGIGWRGGGICNFGTLSLGGSTVTGNSASSWGGGIYNDGTMTISGSTVTGNSASAGGGIFNDTQGNLTILSSVVQDNAAQDGADICSLGLLTISKDSKVGKISHNV